jgi:hypothetical protein
LEIVRYVCCILENGKRRLGIGMEGEFITSMEGHRLFVTGMRRMCCLPKMLSRSRLLRCGVEATPIMMQI